MNRFTFTLLFLFSSFFLVGQELNLGNYKYIIVADKFHFVKEVDGFQTSSLTKFLLEKNQNQGFKREWSPIIMPPEKHTGYAVQWFSMTFVLILIFIYWVSKLKD
jgi:cytochrome oxidase assembly protein ShyY1